MEKLLINAGNTLGEVKVTELQLKFIKKITGIIEEAEAVEKFFLSYLEDCFKTPEEVLTLIPSEITKKEIVYG